MSGPLTPVSVAFEESENQGSNPSANDTMGDIIAARFSRRDMLRGALAVSAITATVSPLALVAGEARAQGAAAAMPNFNFTEVPAGIGRDAPRGGRLQRRHPDPLGRPGAAGRAGLRSLKQSASAQAKQFGYNNDYIGYIPLDGSSDHGLLVVNHEYTNEELMFPGLGGPQDAKGVGSPGMTEDLVRDRDGGAWRLGAGDPHGGRRVARGRRQPLQPPHHRRDADGASPAPPLATRG